MPSWLIFVMKLMPMIGQVVDEIHADLADHHKQQIVTHTVNAAAAAVSAIAPKYSNVAGNAASAANAVAGAVADVVDHAQAGDVAGAVTAGIGAAITGVAAATAVKAQVDALDSSTNPGRPELPTPQAEDGPGLHNIVPK